MKAMILAAGLGKRMRPLTASTPKPLLELADRPLIEWHLRRLVAAGYDDLVVNVSYLGEQIERYLGDGSRYGARIQCSREGDRPLETGGGIFRALPLLGDAPFLVVNSDIWCDYPYQELRDRGLASGDLAHLVLVPNPEQHPHGDFILEDNRIVAGGVGDRLTFSGVSLLSPRLFAGCEDGIFPLLDCLKPAIARAQVSAERYDGHWEDVGTPERLQRLDTLLRG